MKIYIIAIAVIIGLPVVYVNLRHTPSQWEMAVQKVAQDGDASNPLFECMRQFDSVSIANKYDIYDDSFMNKWYGFFADYLKSHQDQIGICLGASGRWKSGMYDFAMDYYSTSSYGIIRFVSLLSNKNIYAIPVPWWHRRLAPFN